VDKRILKYIANVRHGKQKVATLSSIFVVEANLPIRQEFSLGVFLYRIGDLLPEEKCQRYKTTSPATLELFLKV
jgi:hypothetical protein